MRYIVGYSADHRGRDALNLGIALARSMRAELDVVLVLKVEDAYAGALRGGGNYTQLVEQQAKEWLQEAADLVPEDVTARYHLRRSTNAATGLMEMAEVINAGAIIVGGSSRTSWLWHGIGSVDNALLHRAKLPVIMAPSSYENSTSITSIDCAVSPKVDSIGLVEEAIATLNRTGLPVRLVCMVDGSSDEDHGRVQAAVESLVADSSVRPEEPEKLRVVVGHGRGIAEAVESVDWDPGAVLMAGSSKLAQRGELFLSSTTSKILSKLPIPVAVVPRDYHPGRYGSEAQPWTGQLKAIDPDQGTPGRS